VTLKSRSLKVFETSISRKLGYCFLFVFHSNDGYILHHFRHKAIYSSKIVIFLYPFAFHAQLGGGGSPRRNIAILFGTKNLEWCGYAKVTKD